MLVNLSIKQIMMLKSKILRDKIPSITNLATTAALIAVEDKMLMLISLSKKHIWYKNIRSWEKLFYIFWF